MKENTRTGYDFVGYEYIDIAVNSTKVSMYLDGYENFGWQLDKNFGNVSASGKTMLHLRRDRKILNKMELTRLQRNFEASMEEIDSLEHSKTTKPQITALTIGIIGTAFMAGSVFAVTATPPIIWLCILLAIPGFIGWILPYFTYKKLVEKRASIVNPLIEQKHDEIYELCKKGSELLN